MQRNLKVLEVAYEVVEVTGYDPVTKRDNVEVRGLYSSREAADYAAKGFAVKPPQHKGYMVPDKRFYCRRADGSGTASILIGERTAA